MSKRNELWEYLRSWLSAECTLTFYEIEQIAKTTVDHSFLTCKKELHDYSWTVEKISMQHGTVHFARTN